MLRVCYFKRQLTKFMEEKPSRDVQVQDTTAGSLGLNTKMPEAREYYGKVTPILPYTLPFGHFQK